MSYLGHTFFETSNNKDGFWEGFNKESSDKNVGIEAPNLVWNLLKVTYILERISVSCTRNVEFG